MERIEINPDFCNGKPVIRGQRITVGTILEFLSAGNTVDEILEQYPTVTAEDVYACLRFAAEIVEHEYKVHEIAARANI